MNQIILSNKYFNIEEKNTGDTSPYYVMNCADSVICCVLDKDDNFWMVKQKRPALNEVTLEMPAGGIEEGETAKDAMIRELKEEIQCECKLIAVGKNYALMGSRTNMKTHYFFGMDPIKNKYETKEILSMKKVQRSKFKNKIQKGEFTQVAGLANLYLIQLKLGISVLDSTSAEIRSRFMNEYYNRGG